MTSGVTERDRAKAERQSALLREAAALFAERGFAGVSLEDIGAAVGVSGPAIYRHFANKQALLGAVLVRVSEGLLAGGLAVRSSGGTPADMLDALVRFHVDFALADADVIRVQDRDLASLSDADRHSVRRLQREYVEVWVEVLGSLHAERTEADLRVRAHAAFGLMNSTPYSARIQGRAPAASITRPALEDMARAALRA